MVLLVQIVVQPFSMCFGRVPNRMLNEKNVNWPRPSRAIKTAVQVAVVRIVAPASCTAWKRRCKIPSAKNHPSQSHRQSIVTVRRIRTVAVMLSIIILWPLYGGSIMPNRPWPKWWTCSGIDQIQPHPRPTNAKRLVPLVYPFISFFVYPQLIDYALLFVYSLTESRLNASTSNGYTECNNAKSIRWIRETACIVGCDTWLAFRWNIGSALCGHPISWF